MVMSIAGTVVANEATRDRGDGDSFTTTAFKFGILVIALIALVALLVGLWLFNNWAGIVDLGEGIAAFILNAVGGFWGGLTGLVPAIGSWLLPTSRSKTLSSVRGVDPSAIV